MKITNYTFSIEPRDKFYFDLIDIAQSICKFAWLVIRPTMPLDPSGDQALQALNKHLYQVENVNEWPGTKLLFGTANLFKYNFSKECASDLKKLANGLFDWSQPRLPEDLCLLIDEESPLLVSISHERDGYLLLTKENLLIIKTQISEFYSFIKFSA